MADGAPGVTVIIPARYGSSRFPGKPLARLLGRPLIEHVYERAHRSRGVDGVLVATDDPRIRDAVVGFGGRAVLTTEAYRTGSDRVAGVARTLPGDVFVNLQGDEIFLHPDLLSDLVQPFRASGAGMGTLKRRLESTADFENPSIVKVVTDASGHALYFSRAPIPHLRDQPARAVAAGLHYGHLGLYIYTRATLERFAALPTGALEDAEKLEQLRAMEHGIRIRVWETVHPSLRIDRPEDLTRAEAELRRLVPA